MKKKLCCIFVVSCILGTIFAEEGLSLTASSVTDWTKRIFSSDISLFTKEFPVDRALSQNTLHFNIPFLLKDSILSINVDSSKKLGDLINTDEFSIHQLTEIVDDGKKTASYFSNTAQELKMQHHISLHQINAALIRHATAYTPREPIDTVPSRKYSGIIIDARGLLPVHGEYTSENGKPCLFPKIWDDEMNLVYERNMVDSGLAKKMSIVSYSHSINDESYKERVGKDPLRITARKIYGMNRTDPVISRNDALKILSVPENLALLREGKVVILLNEDSLVYNVSVPHKTENYYLTYQEIKKFYFENKIPNISVENTYKGIQIILQNINFIADSPEILPTEDKRLDEIAKSLIDASKKSAFSILVEGHTASVGKPTGEMNLSVERAQTIINEMVKRGIPRSMFSFKGYGGTVPLADNATEEGRAINRRVELILMPVTTYIQRLP